MSENDQELLNDWFNYREVNDEDDLKFLHFWHRNLNLYYSRYLLMLESELSEIPELSKASYIEVIHNLSTNKGVVTNTHSGKDTMRNTGTDSTAHTGTVSNDSEHENVVTRGGSVTHDKVGNDTTATSGHSLATNTGDVVTDKNGYDTTTNTGTTTVNNTGTQTSEQTRDSKHSDVSLAGPQSQSYPGATAGNMPNLDWQYVSSQNQSADNSGENTRTDNLQQLTTDDTQKRNDYNTVDTVTNDLETEANESGTSRTDYNTLETQTNNLRDADTGTAGNITTYNNTDSRTANMQNETTYGSKVESENNLENESDTMHAGRNELETEIRRKIYEFVGSTIAFKWLYDKLDVCFMGVYD